MSKLQFTDGQKRFIRRLAADTGLNSRVIAAQVYTEMNGSAASIRQRDGNHNWLNVGYFDSGPGSLTKDRTWRSPESAADATAKFLKGQKYGASQGIRNILKSVGGSPDQQINAIARSGWATNPRYGETIRSVWQQAPAYGAGSPTPSTPSTTSSSSSPQTRTVTTPGVDRSAERQQLKMQYLLNRHDPNALLMLKQGLDQAQDTPSQTTQVRTGGSGSVGASSGVRGASTGITEAARREAQRINDARVPYQWGGGHGGRQARGSKVTPLDCSGAVSRVLGIDPRVASQFKSFGSPGRAPGGKGITIYAKDDHVLMEINGHLFGTSKSNPGGGAGWIKRSDVPAGYLSRFTARHLANS